MKRKSLLVTNIHLKDSRVRDRLLRQTVISSSAVEGVVTPAARALAPDYEPSAFIPTEASGPKSS